MSGYPVEIILEDGSEELEFLTKHSGLLKELEEIETPIRLNADILFGGDQSKWKAFVDVFFPGVSENPYFGYKNGKTFVRPERGTKENLRELVDFFLVDTPETMMNFARKQATKQLNAPSVTAARGVGIRRPGRGARQFMARQARFAPRGHWNNNSNNENAGNNESRKAKGPEIKVNNNGENYNNNNTVNRTAVSRARPMTLGNFLPPQLKTGLRTRRSKTRRANRKQTRRGNRK